MRTPPLLADFTHARTCNPFCEKSLTLPSASDGKICLPVPFLLPFSLLYDLPQDAAHGLSGLVLLLPRSVGVGAQGKASVVVPQHGGHGFDVHAVLEGCGGEGVPEIVESDAL